MTEELIKLFEDGVENHLNVSYDCYFSLLFNAYESIQQNSNNEVWENIVKEILNKLQKSKLEPKIAALKTMMEKGIPFPLISAYLQVIGFIDLCLNEEKNSCFTTIRHGNKTHLQIFVNDAQNTILLPFDIENALSLLAKNINLVGEHKLLQVFTNHLLFNHNIADFLQLTRYYLIYRKK